MPVKDRDKQLNPAEKRYGNGGHDDLGVHPERREAEVEDYNKRLSEVESSPERQNSSKQEEVESKKLRDKDLDEPDSRWKTLTDNKGKRFTFNKRKAVASGGIFGVLIGGGIGFFGFLAGPLQFIHMAQVLQSFHMSDVDEFTDGRAGKLMRYATKGVTGSTEQDRNMSSFGNKIAVHYENKLRSRGIDFEYRVGRLNKITVDPNTPEGKRLIAEIEADYGGSMPRDADGKVRFDLASSDTKVTSTAKVRRSLINRSVKAAGMNKVSSAIASRMLKIRAGVNFHPLKNTARAADENFRLRYEEWKQRRTDQVRDGTQPEPRTNLDGTSGADESTTDADRANAEKLDGKAEEIANKAKQPNTDFNTRVANVKAALGAGVGVTAAAGLICGLDAIGDAAGDLQESNVIKPLIRTGGDALAVASQIMTGQDLNFEQLGALSESFYDEENETSWVESKSILAEQGKEGGVEIPPTAKPTTDNPGFFAIVDDIVGAPGISDVCGVVNTTAGGIALAIAGIAANAAGPWTIALGAASEGVQTALAAELAPHLVRWLAGEAVDIANFAGADYGSIANYGVFLSANNQMKGMGGRALESEERLALDYERQERQKIEMSNKTLYARILKPTEPNSLFASTVLANTSFLTTSSTVASATAYPSNILGSIGSSLKTMLPGAYAQTEPFDYGVPEFGFSLDEINSPSLENPYENAEMVEGNLASLNFAYGETCFGTTIDPTTKAINYTDAPSYKELEAMKDTCGSQDAVRYRMYLADMATMKAITCYEGIDDVSCNELGLGGTEVSDTNTASAAPVSDAKGVDTSAQQCQIGQDGGIQNTPVEGIKIRICILEGIDYNVAIEQNVKAILDGAKAAGINFSGSGGFRSYDEQVRLRMVNNCADIYTASPSTCSPATARPGTSMHEWGLALDLAVNGSTIKSGSAGFKWMRENEALHGLKNLPSEPWHWSTTGS